MSRQLSYVLVADGGTDRALVPIVEWAVHRLDPEVEILEPEFRKRVGTVRDYVDALQTGAMLVFVHRDSENASLEIRLEEFRDVARSDVVPVVPVRMTEAWLLIDKDAIALAADRPGAQVDLPAVHALETIADPKTMLQASLLAAAGNPSGRRGKRFRRSLVERRVNVASLVRDYAALESLPAFRRFQSDLRSCYPFRDAMG